MTERTSCWHCDREVDASALDFEAVLVPRTAGEGGPVLLWHCRSCGNSSVAERNPAGERLLVPPHLFGMKSGPARSPAAAAARRWAAENALRREAFRTRSGPAVAGPGPAPPPEPAPDPEPEPERASPREVSSVLEAYEILDLPLTADAETIRRRFRDLTRKCHPDRVAGLDEEIRRTAERRWREIRRAYEVLTGE